MSMTTTQQTALESLAGRALTAEEVAAIGTIWDDDVRPDAQIADIISAGRTEVYTRLVSARGLAEHVPGGPLAAEVILMKLEGAAATMLATLTADSTPGSVSSGVLTFDAANYTQSNGSHVTGTPTWVSLTKSDDTRVYEFAISGDGMTFTGAIQNGVDIARGAWTWTAPDA